MDDGYLGSVSTSMLAQRARLGLVVVCSAHFLIGADGLAVATALPSLQRNMDVAPIDSQWVLSAYGLTFGSSLLLGGRLESVGLQGVQPVGVGATAGQGGAGGIGHVDRRRDSGQAAEDAESQHGRRDRWRMTWFVHIVQNRLA
jgi:MFS family permease